MKNQHKPTAKTTAADSSWELLQMVSDVAELLRAQPPTQETLVTSLKRVAEVIPFDGATLYLARSEDKDLRQVASLGSTVELLSFLNMEKGEGLSGWTANNKKPILLSERSTVGSFNPDSEYGTFASIPLLAVEEVIGVLNIGCRRPSAITESDITLLALVATQMTLAMERQEAREALEDQAARLEVSSALDQEEASSASRDLQEAVEMLEVVSNDINNSLSVIVGNIQCLILEKSGINQKALSRLKRMESAALEIGKINRRLRDISAGASDQTETFVNPTPSS